MPRSIRKIIFLFSCVFCLALSACAAPVSAPIASTPTAVATPVATTSDGPTTPPLFYIANNQLYELQADGTSLSRAALEEQGNVLDAIQVKEAVFVLRGNGIQRVDLLTGATSMAVTFDKEPVWGELALTANDEVLLYSRALDLACASTGIGVTIGLSQLNENTFQDVFTKAGAYARPLGLTAERQGIYSLPLGCDPSFDRLWQISIQEGRITTELPTWDPASNHEYGEGYAALSPDARSLAFLSLNYVGEQRQYRLSVYQDVGVYTISRYELPRSPSHTGELLWSPNGQTIYFILNPGTPTDESTESYGVWSFDVRTGDFVQVTELENRSIHIVSISDDGQWILLQPEVEQSVTYVHLPTGEKVRTPLPPEGITRLVR